jgi:hypothetical protein
VLVLLPSLLSSWLSYSQELHRDKKLQKLKLASVFDQDCLLVILRGSVTKCQVLRAVLFKSQCKVIRNRGPENANQFTVAATLSSLLYMSK